MKWPWYTILLVLSMSSMVVTKSLSQSERLYDDNWDKESSGQDSFQPLYSIEGMIKLPPGFTFSTARIMLNGKYAGLARTDGKFKLFNNPAGTYSLEVKMVDFLFSPIRIDISARDKGKVSAFRLASGGKRMVLRYPLLLRPIAKANYFAKRQPFNWMGLLRNPMVIMIGLMGMVMLLSLNIKKPE